MAEPKLASISRPILFDANIHRKIKMKRLSFSLVQQQELIKIEKMFDQFYIFGAAPDDSQPKKPTLLVSYPSTSDKYSSNDGMLKHLKSFCFPNGFRELSKKKSDNILLSEFVFYFSNEATDKTFGICVQFQIPDNVSPFFASNLSKKYPFCLCFLTKVPYLSSHFQFASYLALMLCGDQQSFKASLSSNPLKKPRLPLPVHGFCNKALTMDKNYPSVAVIKGFHVPKLLYDELSFFHSLEVNHEKGSSIPIPLSADMSLYLPSHFTRNKCLAYPTFHAFFSALTPETIITIYTALLLEQRILFVSKDKQLASFSVIASTSLIAPFSTQANVMPILPCSKKFQNILQSPVPYVIGSTKENNDVDVIVFLDKNTISLQSPLPTLPGASALAEKLENLLNDSAESILVPPKENKSFFGHRTHNPSYDKFMNSTNVYVYPTVFTKYIPIKYILTPFVIEDILSLFADFLAPSLTDSISSCFVTDTTDPENPITVFNKDLLLSIIPDNEKEFYSAFLSTQIFSEFCEAKTDDFSRSKLDFYHVNPKAEVRRSNSLPQFVS